MPDRIFKRDFTINIGGLRIASRLQDETRLQLGLRDDDPSNILKVVCNITKTVKKEPNKAEVTIYNLKESNRIALQQRKQPTIIEAGYVDNVSVLFEGILEYSSSFRDGRDWITTLQTADGADKKKKKRVNRSFKGPAKARDVLRAAARALDLKPGNLAKAIKRGSLRGDLSEFSNGYVMSGKADKELDKIARSMGYFYSIQDGQLILIGTKDFLGTTAALLTPQTGLVGSPEPGEDGFVNARAMLQPNLLPAHRVELRSDSAEGIYRIERVDFSLDTRGQDWYGDLELRPLGGSS